MKISNHNFWALCADVAEEVFTMLHNAENAAENAASLIASQGLRDVQKTAGYSVENGIAIIKISGPIDREARISFFTGEPYTAGQDQIRAAISGAMQDRAVKGILLDINSPGGVVAGTKELADFIAACSKRKPFAAYADGMMASAAYWLAAATGNIYAPLTAQVGSIGVIAVLTDWTKAAGKAGITRTVIHSGKWKAAGSPDKELTEEERALFQSRLEAIHSIFAADVASHMNISDTQPQALGTWAEGQTFLAEQALSFGLVSKIVQDLDGAITALSAIIQNGDSIMNLDELKAQHPDLVEALAHEFQEGQEAALQEAAVNARKETLELVTAIGGEELTAKISEVIEAGVTAQQFKALAPVFAKTGISSKSDAEADVRSAMLEAMQAAHGAPINAGPDAAPKISPLVADAERRSK